MTADSSKTTFTMVTVIFILLAILFSGVVALYWVTALEPRLKAEAVSQAEILARSQADFVGDSVRAEGDVETRRRRVTAALDELLLLRVLREHRVEGRLQRSSRACRLARPGPRRAARPWVPR